MQYKTIKELMTALANIFRDYLGITEKIPTQEFPDRVHNIYLDARDKGYNDGFKNGKSTLYGTYILKETISADELPSINATQNLAGKGARAYFRSGAENYISREVEKITFKASGEPRFSVRSKSAYSEEWNITSYALTEYEGSKNQWVSKYYLNDRVSTYNTDTKSRIITFAEPITVSEAFYNAFCAITDISTDIYIEGENKGIEQGKQAQYDEYWDEIQDFGKRVNYSLGMCGNHWTKQNFKPKYPIKPTNSMANCFAYWNDTFFEDLIDFREVCELDTSEATSANNAFYANRLVYAIGVLDLRKCKDVRGILNSCINLVITEKIILGTEYNSFDNAFTNCNSLEEVRFEGPINQSINLQWSKNLTLESLISVLTHLFNFYSSGEEWSRTIILAVESWDLLKAQGAAATNPITGEACTWIEYVEACCWLRQ